MKNCIPNFWAKLREWKLIFLRMVGNGDSHRGQKKPYDKLLLFLFGGFPIVFCVSFSELIYFDIPIKMGRVSPIIEVFGLINVS